MVVVDACVAVKWFLPEEGSDRALALLSGKDALVAPSLIRTEVAGAIVRRVRMGTLTTEDAKNSLHMWFEALGEGVIQVTGDLEDLKEAVNFSLQLQHPIQDCLYLAVARRRSARLITADHKFVAKALSVFPAIEAL
ncbi:MAG: type II toxin-antitoxin system VapC family toxin [Bryobacterales bacterium]|nr:type II toxin-antitoxin system VapC family toxin [Bryobacterales bacterium]